MEHLVGIEPTYFGWKPNVFTKSLQMQKRKRPHMATFGMLDSHGESVRAMYSWHMRYVNYPEIPES